MSDNSDRRAAPVAAFALVTVAASWALWRAAFALHGGDLSQPSHPPLVGPALYLLGVFAPALVALALTAWEGGSAAVQALLRRTLLSDVGAQWYAFAVLYFIGVKLTLALVHRVALGGWPAFTDTPVALMFGATAISTPTQAGEEIGWRGFLLPRLSAWVGLPLASLVVGVIWAAWHLPFFFVAGADKSGQSFPIYLLAVMALSVTMAWLYWRTGGSLLLTMLMHAAINNTNLISTPPATGTGVWAMRTSFVAWGTAAILWVGAVFFLMAMRGAKLDASIE